MESSALPECHLLIDRLSSDLASAEGRFPALEKLLAIGLRSERACGWEGLLCELFGMGPRQEMPLAALSLLGGEVNPGRDYWLRADPVHFQLQRDSFVLADPASVRLSREESCQLAADLNRHFAAEGLAFLAPHPECWYLKPEGVPRLTTHTLAQALGRDVAGLLPQGEDATAWRRLLNELQMLLHQHPVNLAREERGELPVNSVWLYGGGVLPDGVAADFTHVWADDVLARGLAMVSGVQPAAVPLSASEWLDTAPTGVHLIVLDRHALQQLEEDWCAPLLQSLRRGSLRALTLHWVGPGRVVSCRATRRDLWKFWRRRKPLEAGLG